VAYDSQVSGHLLNVPADRMGALAADPAGFLVWLQRTQPSRGITAQQFVPRSDYGDYLRWQVTNIHAAANVHSVHQRLQSLRKVTQPEKQNHDASGRHDLWQLSTGDGAVYLARRVLLALGAGLPSDPGNGDNLVANPWSWLQRNPAMPPLSFQTRVVIFGSGLTAMDLVLALRERGHQGEIEVVSRSGCWSAAHEPTPALEPDVREAFINDLLASPSCRSYLIVFRRYALRHPWRALFDAIRPASQSLWVALAAPERRRFLRHLFGLWNRHRHRAPPVVAEEIKRDSKLRLSKQRITRASDPFPTAEAVERGQEIIAFDCRGLRLGSRAVRPSVVRDLEAEGWLREGELGLGVQSTVPESLEIIGALRFGIDFECTAVPELRNHAALIAERWSEV